MLKIKDDVDIEEVKEKTLNDRALAGFIYIDEIDRNVSFIGDHYHEVSPEALDFLYDLIQVGLVEKVEGSK